LKVCFYANTPRADVRRIEFYNNDLRILQELGCEITVAESLGDVLRAEAPALYFVWWWNRALLPILAARLRRVPVVVCGVLDYFLPYSTAHDFVSRPWWQRLLMRRSLAMADVNIFISRYEYQLVPRMLEVRAPRMVYLAIDSDVYREKVVAPRPKRILNVSWSGAENAKRKGLFELVRAFQQIHARHPEARLVLAGRRGDALPHIEALVRQLGIASAVELLGEIDVQEKVRQMQLADLYVQPSMFEGFGSAVAEAMSCGTPAACTLQGALPEVMGAHGVPILGTTDADIVDAVERFFALPESERRAKGRESARFVRQSFSYGGRKDALKHVLDGLSLPLR
jgi:glycosyltransferase involved in cell wall biosynthesis